MIPQLAQDHTWTETSRTAATCTTAGEINYICSVCNETKSEPLESLEHTWNETSRTPASCLTAGSILYTCSRCNETKTETIPQLGTSHIWTVSGQTAATCTTPGRTGYTCSRCGEVKQETSPALDHDWQETSRTETEIHYTCSTCGETKTEPIKAPSNMAMSALLEKITAVFSTALDWTGTVAETIAANPMLLLCVVLGFIGTGVLLFKRLLRL